jgi:hypothetical protein
VFVFALVGPAVVGAAQRPRAPAAENIAFVHPVNAAEGSLFDAIVTATHSARGEYTRERAPLPGEPTW